LQKRKRALWLLGLLVAVVVFGCASLGKVKPIEHESVAEEAVDAKKGWWYARFKMDWPQDADPAWYVDYILAHKVISPVLDEYGREISLWRFHRRAVRDKSGKAGINSALSSTHLVKQHKRFTGPSSQAVFSRK